MTNGTTEPPGDPGRDTTVVHHDRNGGSGGIYAVLVIIVVLIVGAVLYFAGVFGGQRSDGDTLDIRIETPDISPPATPPAQPDPPGAN